ncbi:MAG: anti-sigma factor [Pseudomonadota bacterium]
MSRKDDTEFLSRDGMAFDYVTGVMRGEERKRFAAALQHRPELQEQVQFWEEQLINLSDTAGARNPHVKTWPAIEQRIQQSLTSTTTRPSRWTSWLTFAIPSVMTAIIVSCLFIFLPQQKQLSTDYVAVLTDTTGEPLLTSLTETSNNIMWLKWEREAITPNKNLQLWAISKRDGQTRSIAVFAQTSSGKLPLSTASLRLVKEAASLILTEEDVGGSALDEPSATLLAKGACVLLIPEPETITPTSKNI